ncbi:MAG TPA: hypothetical protein P5081_12765 [Phycisphaerae bacterium]|nr:hypothetical protein [Phycisphaerae bacterium]HRW53749.1 hypothetical protein [Phycisphaerae bacterium]
MAQLVEFNQAHIQRLYKIATALSAKRGMSVPQVAKKFRISVRTAFREMNVLRDLKVDLVSEDGVHHVGASSTKIKRVISDQCRTQLDDLLKRSLK